VDANWTIQQLCAYILDEAILKYGDLPVAFVCSKSHPASARQNPRHHACCISSQ